MFLTLLIIFTINFVKFQEYRSKAKLSKLDENFVKKSGQDVQQSQPGKRPPPQSQWSLRCSTRNDKVIWQKVKKIMSIMTNQLYHSPTSLKNVLQSKSLTFGSASEWSSLNFNPLDLVDSFKMCTWDLTCLWDWNS